MGISISAKLHELRWFWRLQIPFCDQCAWSGKIGDSKINDNFSRFLAGLTCQLEIELVIKHMGYLKYHSLYVIPKHLSIVCRRGGSRKPTKENVHPFIVA